MQLPEFNPEVIKAYILLFEVLFENALILKSLVTQTGVTKGLMLALELVVQGEAKLAPLKLAFMNLGLPLLTSVLDLIERSHVFYIVVRMLSCYLMNKIQLDYPLSQDKTFKQLKQENFLLACELQRQLLDKQVNKLGPEFDPAIRLIWKNFLNEVVQTAEKYRKTELPHLNDSTVLNLSLSDIIGKYEVAKSTDDLVKVNIYQKAKLPYEGQ